MLCRNISRNCFVVNSGMLASTLICLDDIQEILQSAYQLINPSLIIGNSAHCVLKCDETYDPAPELEHAIWADSDNSRVSLSSYGVVRFIEHLNLTARPAQFCSNLSI